MAISEKQQEEFHPEKNDGSDNADYSAFGIEVIAESKKENTDQNLDSEKIDFSTEKLLNKKYKVEILDDPKQKTEEAFLEPPVSFEEIHKVLRKHLMDVSKNKIEILNDNDANAGCM